MADPHATQDRMAEIERRSKEAQANYAEEFGDLIYHLLVLGGVEPERAQLGSHFGATMIVKKLVEDGRV